MHNFYQREKGLLIADVDLPNASDYVFGKAVLEYHCSYDIFSKECRDVGSNLTWVNSL